MSLHPSEEAVFVTGSVDKTARLWDLRFDHYAFDWKISTTTLARNYSRIPGCTQMLWGHTSDVSSVAFHPSGLSFATCSEDKTVSQGFLAMQKKALMIDRKCNKDKS